MKIVEGDSTYEGVKKDENGKIVCEKCGKSDRCKMVSHIDGTDFYGTSFECECGNHVGVTTKRTQEDMMMWS